MGRLPAPARALAVVAVVLAVCATLLAPPTARAGTRSITDNGDYDVVHRDIDVDRLTVTYTRKVARAEVRYRDLRQVRRLRLFVGFLTRESPDPESPLYGNLVELRLAPNGTRSTINWLVDPADEGYTKRGCRGVKATPDYRRDVITYVVPRRCMHFITTKGYVSARKYTAAHWHGGDPGRSTGDWFDTTYTLRTPR